MNSNNTFPKAIFITGTDTDCGKTFVTSTIICAFKSRGLRVVGMKPVASGSKQIDGRLINGDVEALKFHANVQLPDRVINPYIFAPPISPHFAAADEGVKIDLDKISDAFNRCCEAADIVIVEGAGGWRVPLDNESDISCLVEALNLPVILVSGLKLGCINHTLLSAQSIRADGVDLIGWVANTIDPTYKKVDATINYMAARLGCPLAARFRWNHGQNGSAVGDQQTEAQRPNPIIAAQAIDLDLLETRITGSC